MADHFPEHDLTYVAFHTYGKERVKDARSKTWVSAYKIGYTSAASQALLFALDTKRVRGVSTPTASYNYFQIEGEFVPKGGYLVFQLTPAQVAKAEEATRRHLRAEVYGWRDGAWWEFPTKDAPNYTSTAGRTAPTFDPVPLFVPKEEQPAVNGVVSLERSEREAGGKVWWWIGGETYPYREILKAQGARWSGKRKQWYFIGEPLPDAIQQLAASCNPLLPMPPELATPIEAIVTRDQAAETQDAHVAPEVQASPSAPDVTPELPLPSTEETRPAIHIVAPEALPLAGEPMDAVQTALSQLQQMNRDTFHTLSNGSPGSGGGTRVRPIRQAYCGELTGSITGDVHCYGWAVHDGVCVYLNLGGPRMAVEAIRAKLGKGEQVSLIPPDAPAVELTAGEGESGMYRDYFAHLPEARFTSLILLHEWAHQPNYGGASVTFLFRTMVAHDTDPADDDLKAKVRHHVTQLVAVAVFDDWTDYLWQAGGAAGLITTTLSGGVDLLTLHLDATAWTRLIAGGLAQGLIHLPIP